MRKGGKGEGIVWGKGRVYTLAYADDGVLKAKEKSGVRLMMSEFQEYVREKNLFLKWRKQNGRNGEKNGVFNVEKIKVVRCRK